MTATLPRLGLAPVGSGDTAAEAPHDGAERGRARARTQWLVLAAALTVLAGTLVAWGLGRAAARVEVVSVARPVERGTVLTVDDLTLSSIAVDGTVQGLVPAGSLERLVGRTTALALEPGMLLSVGMWSDGTQLLAGEQTVGAVLDPGRFPAGLGPAGRALAVATDDAAGPAMAVRVLVAELDDPGALHVTFAAPADRAVDLARLAALDALVLVGLPDEVDTEEAP
jgi:hypothetical protein